MSRFRLVGSVREHRAPGFIDSGFIVSGFIVLLLLTLTSGLTACATPEPDVPPTPLTPLTSTDATMATVRQQWSVSVGDKDKRGLTRFVPLVLDNTVYAASIDGNVVALDLASGKRIWRRKLGRPLASGVAGDDQSVYVSERDGTILALSRDAGKSVWEYTMSSEVLSQVAAGFGMVVARSADGRIVGINAEDGTERWSNTYTPPALTVHGYGQPRLLDNGVLIGLDDGKVIALSLDAGRVLWESVVAYPTGRSEVERLVDVDADILVDSQYIYAANYQGALVKLEPVQGQRLWSTQMSTTSGMDQRDDRLFVSDSFDRIHAINKQSGETLWQQDKLLGRGVTRPVVVADTLVVADFEGYVHMLSLETGALTGRARLGKSAARQLIPIDGGVLMQSVDGRLRFFSTTDEV